MSAGKDSALVTVTLLWYQTRKVNPMPEPTEPLKFQDTREREEWLRAYLAIVTSPNPVLREDGTRFFACGFADHALGHLRQRALRGTHNAPLELADEHRLTADEVLDVILDAAFDDDRLYTAIIEGLKARGVAIAPPEPPAAEDMDITVRIAGEVPS